MPPALLGQTLLNQYRIDEFIRSTPLGDLYRVTDVRSNRIFTLTQLPKSIAENSEALKELEEVAGKLRNIKLSNVAMYYNVEIIVSFLKNHCLKTTWIEANPALARMITSGFFKTSHLESLFESCRNNKVFLNDFEEYISRLLLIRSN